MWGAQGPQVWLSKPLVGGWGKRLCEKSAAPILLRLCPIKGGREETAEAASMRRETVAGPVTLSLFSNGEGTCGNP
jgi:hypothetical protein